VEVVDDEPARPAARAGARRGGPPPRPARAGRKPAADDVGFEVVDDEDEEEARPRPRPKRKSGSNKGPVIALVAALVLLVLGGAGGLAWWLLSGGSDDPMAYVPADSQFVIGVDGQALLNSSFGPQLEQLLNSPAVAPLVKYKQDTKAQNRDLFQRIVVGLRRQGNELKGVIAIKSAVPWDAAKLAAAFGNANKQSVAGTSVYRVTMAGSPTALSTPNKNVAVMADIPDDQLGRVFKAAGKGPSLPADLTTLTNKFAGETIWFATAIDDSSRQQVGAVLAQFAGGSKAVQTAAQQAKGAAMAIKLNGGQVEIKSGVLMADAAAAQRLADEMRQEGQKPPALPMQAQAILLAMPSVKKVMDEANASQQFTTDGPLAIVTATVAMSTLEAAFQEAAKMGQAFGGGAPGQPPGGMPGQPPAGPPPGTPGGPPARPRGRGSKGGGRP
jgi:hypothetical protein